MKWIKFCSFFLIISIATNTLQLDAADAGDARALRKKRRAEVAASMLATSPAKHQRTHSDAHDFTEQAPELYELTPTLAHLSAPELQKEVKRSFSASISRQIPELRILMQREEQFQETHIPLYHAQEHILSLITDFLSRLHAYRTGNPLRPDFQFLRYKPIGSQHKDVYSFIDSFGPRQPVNDHVPQYNRALLAVNFSLWGNVMWSGESTFSYFEKDYSSSVRGDDGLRMILKEIFDYENLNYKFLTPLIDLMSKPAFKSGHGTLYQIFVNRDKADQCVYLSRPFGQPSEILRDKKRRLIAPRDVDTLNERYKRCTGVLGVYTKTPERLMHKDADSFLLDKLQGRLLLSQDYVLDPASDVKIFKHTFNDRDEKAYSAALDALCVQIFTSKKKQASIARPLSLPAMAQAQIHQRVKDALGILVDWQPEVERCIIGRDVAGFEKTLEKMGKSPTHDFEKFWALGCVYALKNSDWRIPQLIMDHTGRTDFPVETELLDAVKKGDVKSVTFLIDVCGANPHTFCPALLDVAMQHKQKKVAKLLRAYMPATQAKK